MIYDTLPDLHLNNAKQHFKLQKESHLIKNVIYDIGTGYTFPPKPVSVQIPPGTYHINSTRDHDFILSKVTPSNIDLDEDDLHDLLLALGEEPAERQRLRNSDIQDYVREENYGFLDKGYFPMHQYNEGLSKVHEEIIRFLNNKSFYEKANLGFKRSILLYGSHGVGKSKYLDWLSKQLIKELDAIVIRINSGEEIDRLNEKGVITLNRVVKDRLIVFLIEELSNIASYRSSTLSLLNVLDNPLLRENVLFLSTTNNPDRIPVNIIDRHQRIDTLVEITPKKNKADFADAFYEFIYQEEFPEKYKESEWYKKDLTPATMKELFIYAQMNAVDLDEAFKLIKERERLIRNDFQITEPIGFGLFAE